MKIHSICMVKNKSDIITPTFKSAATWSEFIYVSDNGSTDGTWEKVINLAKDYKQIIPYKQESKPYAESLRSEPFNDFRGNSSDRDWWCQLDADDILMIPKHSYPKYLGNMELFGQQVLNIISPRRI